MKPFKIKKALILGLFIITIVLSFPKITSAQDASGNWSQCADGRQITSCRTYDCPKGDTNKDGTCTLNDDGAYLSNSRSDAFCANPVSGCGVVLYYTAGDASYCAIRVKESGTNCDLYKSGNANFTPVPSSTPLPTTNSTPTPTPSSTATPSPTPTDLPNASESGTTKGGNKLPETGPELYVTGGIILLGFVGLYLFEKYRAMQ